MLFWPSELYNEKHSDFEFMLRHLGVVERGRRTEMSTLACYSESHAARREGFMSYIDIRYVVCVVDFRFSRDVGWKS